MKRFQTILKKIGEEVLHVHRIAIIVSLFLTACAMPSIPFPNFFVTATVAPVASVIPASTATDTPTITPTQPTPTFTPTPTLIGEKTKTPTASSTSIPSSPTKTDLDTPTPISTVILEGFNTVTLSANEFYIGNCEPSEVKFTAQVSKPTVVAFVVLFVRFKSVTTGVTSSWTSLTMENLGAGTFTHTLVPDEMKAVDSFENPWVQYQLVATDANRREVGRTQKFDEVLRLKSCDLLTPVSTTTP